MNNGCFALTAADINAITLGDSNYINGKGARLYLNQNYRPATEYYRLAAAMGNVDAISNLGYCYLYGRGIEPDVGLAVSYFKIAAAKGNVDAAYKLGDIYGSNKWVEKMPSCQYTITEWRQLLLSETRVTPRT